MRLADLDEVMEIESYSFATPWERSIYEADLTQNPRSMFYVARDGKGSVVGYIGSWKFDQEVHVGTVATREDMRRAGVARMLIYHTAKEAVERGAEYLVLEVRVSNANAVALYEKLGFKKVGVRKRYYSDNGEDADLMMHTDLPRLAAEFEAGIVKE
jgi:ribosomal-protein-alanine N-acetyltransferase